MNRKIKIYSIVLTLIYVTLIGYHLINGFVDFKTGLEMGSASQKSESDISIYHFKVEPVNGRYSFPEEVTNLLTNKPVNMEASEYRVKLFLSDEAAPGWVLSLNIVKVVLSLFIIVVLFYIPILFFGIIKSVTKDRIIDSKVIGKIKRIGWLLICFFIYDFIFYKLLEPIAVRHIIQFEEYNIVYDFSDFSLLILGLVTLIMSEILSMSLKLKEEQDFTI